MSNTTNAGNAASATQKIYVAGHRGMVGSAIVRTLLTRAHRLTTSSPARMPS